MIESFYEILSERPNLKPFEALQVVRWAVRHKNYDMSRQMLWQLTGRTKKEALEILRGSQDAELISIWLSYQDDATRNAWCMSADLSIVDALPDWDSLNGEQISILWDRAEARPDLRIDMLSEGLPRNLSLEQLNWLDTHLGELGEPEARDTIRIIHFTSNVERLLLEKGSLRTACLYAGARKKDEHLDVLGERLLQHARTNKSLDNEIYRLLGETCGWRGDSKRRLLEVLEERAGAEGRERIREIRERTWPRGEPKVTLEEAMVLLEAGEVDKILLEKATNFLVSGPVNQKAPEWVVKVLTSGGLSGEQASRIWKGSYRYGELLELCLEKRSEEWLLDFARSHFAFLIRSSETRRMRNTLTEAVDLLGKKAKDSLILEMAQSHLRETLNCFGRLPDKVYDTIEAKEALNTSKASKDVLRLLRKNLGEDKAKWEIFETLAKNFEGTLGDLIRLSVNV